jgi:hypothetical protein
MRKVECSEFVKRQTPQSGYSHFNGSWSELAGLADSLIGTGNSKEGYKKGVILLTVPSWHVDKFYSATTTVTEDTKLRINFAPRQRGEAPFLRVSAKGNKTRAAAVEIICYHKDVLIEDDDRSTDTEWEIIAIKARASTEEEPMDPYTMARNFLHLKGGTKGDFSAQQFAESIVYWNNHCMMQGRSKWRYRLGKFSSWFFTWEVIKPILTITILLAGLITLICWHPH